MTRKYAGSYLYSNFGITSPKSFDDLYNHYGVTTNQTDSDSYTSLYSTSTDTWLELISSDSTTILYNNANNSYFISDKYMSQSLETRWFSINQLAANMYNNDGEAVGGGSLSNTEINIYNVSTGDEVKAIEFNDPYDSTTKYLVKGEVEHFEWLTESQLSDIGYSLTPAPSYTEINVYQQSAYLNGGVTQTNMPGSSNYVYSKDGDTDPSGWSPDNYYYWDFSKRYEFGEYENGYWVAYPQSLADMPASTTSDISQYKMILTPYGTNLMYYGFSYYTGGGDLGSREFTCRIYDDTYSAWQNSEHTDQYPSSTGIVTDIPYDLTKIYKILYMLNASEIPVNYEYLYKVVFSESNGFVKVSISGGTSARFARFVFYIEDMPSVEIPIVSDEDDFGDYNWLRTYTGNTQSISPGDTSMILRYDASGGNAPTPSYDTTKSYGIIKWQEASGTTSGRTEFGIVNSSGHFAVENKTRSTLKFYQARVAVCLSSYATIVAVYDSNGNEFNAFRFVKDGVVYYYVLDEIQTGWTDGLSSIGYSLTFTMPTVSVTGDFGNYNWLQPNNSSSTTAVTMDSNDVNTAYNYGVTYSYDATKSYGVVQWQTNVGTSAGSIEVAVVENSGKIALKNVSSSSISICQARVAVCSANQATVVTVYNSSNVAYNAFKFSLNGMDYYYVLDEIQADWTNDLSSIGYSLSPESQYIDVVLGFILSGSANNPPSVNNMRSVTFDTNDYWFGYLLDSVDVDAATALGLTYNEDYLINWDNSFRFEPLDLYLDNGQTSAGFNMSNFYCGPNNTPSKLCIKNYTATSTNTLTWKCRVSKRSVTPYIDVLFGLRYQDGSGWQSKTFSANDYWYAGILTETDRQDLEAFGCTFVNSEADNKQGLIGTIDGNDPNFTFEPIALYSDLAGQNENIADMSNFYCYYGSSNRLQIHNYAAYNTSSVAWKCRITRVVI